MSLAHTFGRRAPARSLSALGNPASAPAFQSLGITEEDAGFLEALGGGVAVVFALPVAGALVGAGVARVEAGAKKPNYKKGAAIGAAAGVAAAIGAFFYTASKSPNW